MGLFAKATRTLGQILAEMGVIHPAKAALPEEELKKLVPEDVYYHALAKLYGKTFIPPDRFSPRKELYLKLHEDWIRAGLIPYELEGNRLYLATDDPARTQSAFINLRNNTRQQDVYLQYVSTPSAIAKAQEKIIHALEEKSSRKNSPLSPLREQVPIWMKKILPGRGLFFFPC